MKFLCITRSASSALISLLLAFSVSVSAAPANSADDDFLLLTIPAIIAASQNRGDPVPPVAISPLDKIKQLAGDWIFSYPGPGFDEEFRFYVATAKIDPTDSGYATIGGAADCPGSCVENLYGAYNARDNIYAVLHQWGPPTTALPEGSGSVFFFRETSRNTPDFDCHFYTDFDGNIDDYYAGYGGSLPCEQLTKSKVSSQAQSARAAQASRYVDPDQRNATKYQIVLDRRNAQAASRSAKSAADTTAVSAYQDIYEFVKQMLPNGVQ